ncbi:MAG: YqgE/AlgH family protein [Planctomycetaceae bacterium]|nr:YqgE/AlgH family protein [Planctomycetaceae bacterium]
MTESLKGKYLIASRQLRDPNFYKSVVLVVEDDATEGTMGLIINHPSALRVSQAVEGFFYLPETEERLFIGGPVEPTALFLLHSFSEYKDGESNILPGIFMGSSAETFEQVIESLSTGNSGRWFRVFSGCAGWAPMQLQNEISRGDWLIHPAATEDLLCAEPYEFWEKMSREATPYQGLIPKVTGNPEHN